MTDLLLSKDEWQQIAKQKRLELAAPDLLAALRGLIRYSEQAMGKEESDLLWNNARAAIAKAEGQATS